MNKNLILNRWKLCSELVLFFSDFKQWCAVNTVEYTDALEIEHSALFYGTDCNVYIPLWASVCKYPNGILNDETTLEIIKFYYRLGYAPLHIDGNPADYIGELLRFMSYMCACTLGRDDMSEDMENFVSLYLLDTVVSIAKNIRKYTDNELYLSAADELLDAVTLEDESETEISEGLCCYDNYIGGRNEEIENAPAKVIMTGGSNNCGGKCSIRTVTEEGCLTSLETGCGIGDPTLRACVRGRGYRQTYMNGQRLRYPMKRIGKRGEGKFRRISWEEAIDTISSEWKRIKNQYGVGSRYVNYGLGINAGMRPDLIAKRLLNLDGGYLNFYGSYSFAATQFITPYIYGDTFSGNSIEDTVNTKYLILWGHNPSETIYSPQGNYLIAQAKEKGAKVVVIDPRKSDTVISVADEWLPIKPSTDGALAAAMAYVIWSEGLQDQHFMDTYCVGFNKEHMPEGVPAELCYKSYIFGEVDETPKTPEWAEKICGIPAETIKRFAIEYASAKPACIFPGLGNQRTGNGEQTTRAMAALACLTGNVGIPGGGAAGFGMAKEEKRPLLPIGTNPYPGSISCFLWTDAIERGAEMTREFDGVQGMDKLDSNIKIMLNLASNALINQHAEINNSIRILQDESMLEFLVCSDIFMTPSAKFADILIPSTCFLEQSNIAGPWRNGHYLLCNNQVIEPMFGCRTEYDWIGEIAKNLGLYEAWSEGRETQSEWVRHIYEDIRKDYPEMPEFDAFERDGGYTYKNPKITVAYEDQIRDPEHFKFGTPSGKIEIFSKRIYDLPHKEIPAIPSYVACPEGPDDELRETYPLQLIGWHTKRRCHSIHDNNPLLEEVEPQRLWINPADAEKRGIKTGDIAEVFNARGLLRIEAKVTDRVIEGVAAIPEGAWFTPDENGIDKRGSVNVITSKRPTPFARGNGQHTNLVEIRKA